MLSDKYNNDIQARIMKNKMEVLDKCSHTLLECLKASLPYHTDPKLMKRYLKIIPNLTYSIREADASHTNLVNASPCSKNFTEIKNNDQLPKGNI